MEKKVEKEIARRRRQLAVLINNVSRLLLALLAAAVVAAILAAFKTYDVRPSPPPMSLPSPETMMFIASAMDSDHGSSSTTGKSAAPATPSTTTAMECDVYDGSWVLDDDDDDYPLYNSSGCPYIAADYACEKWGRMDSQYQKWRWQPRRCEFPKFDGKKLLERLRGKRMVYVGDSINRNQYFSMICLLDSHLEPRWRRRHLEHRGSLVIYRAEGYDATVEFYWSPFLVETNGDDPGNHSSITTLLIHAGDGAMDKHVRQWGDADVLVFDSYLWWKLPIKPTFLNSSLEKEGRTLDIDMMEGFRKSLSAWSEWVELNAGAGSQKQVYYMSQSPVHHSRCYNKKEPAGRKMARVQPVDGKMAKMVAGTVAKLRRRGMTNVRLVEITRMSEYRADGHMAIYKKYWRVDRKTVEANPQRHADCTHWCLPGVPDAWNHLLYYFITTTNNNST